jgi:hypothetical protein
LNPSYILGFDAYMSQCGKSGEAENPYPPDSYEFADYANGWQDAFEYE